MSAPRPPVLIVGAGLSGLVCAVRLHHAGVPSVVLEGEDEIGGRVRTRIVEGFRIDRGFQVLLDAYPTVRTELDAEALDLRAFDPGALVQLGSKRYYLGDPRRQPGALWSSATAPIGGLTDKLKVLALKRHVARGEATDWLGNDRPDCSTAEFLDRRGFSESMRERFFRPFYGGILLEEELGTTCRMFEFTFRMFGEGSAVLPALGMAEIPKQLARRLPEGSIRTDCPVESVTATRVRLAGGEELSGSAVVVATDGRAASGLLGRGSIAPPEFRQTTTIAFGSNEAPYRRAAICLRGNPADGPILHVAVPSNVASEYAPAGQSLVLATAVGEASADPQLEQKARAQLEGWFGETVRSWRTLHQDHIRFALPVKNPGEPIERPVTTDSGVFVCGDHRSSASSHGAMESGARAAEAVVEALEAVTA